MKASSIFSHLPSGGGIELVFITPEMLLAGDSQVFTNPVNAL